MALDDESEAEHQPLKRIKVRKGTTSCWECKRRKKRCTLSPSSAAGICSSCERLGCPCISQEYAESDGSDIAVVDKRIAHVERLASSVADRRWKQQHALQRPRRRRPECLVNPLTGAGEDRMSRCYSLTGYFYSVLPHPFIARLISMHGKAAYGGLREPMRLSKISCSDVSELSGPSDVRAACLARTLIRLAVSLVYIDSTASEHVADLQLSVSPMETARGYAEAAQNLTSHHELLQSSAGCECVMMQGYYSVHFGRIKEAGVSFRQALNIAQRIELPSRAAVDNDEGDAARVACFRLLSADRSLSLYNGECCDTIDGSIYQNRGPMSDEPCQHLGRTNVQIWRRLIERNVRIEQTWQSNCNRETVLLDELRESLIIDQDMKCAMLSIPSTWWALPTVPTTDLDQAKEASFSRLNTTKDHYYTIVLTHLPYVLQAATTHSGDRFTYSRSAAISASREVLLRFPLFQQYKHVPASLRAVEHKAFVAGVVLLLAHMHSHRSFDFDAIDHERPKDLNALLGTIYSMEYVFARDRHNPGSECARTLRRLMEIEQEMACGAAYDVTCFYDPPAEFSSMDMHAMLDIQLPYFGTLRIERERTGSALEVSPTSAIDFDLLHDDRNGKVDDLKMSPTHCRVNSTAHSDSVHLDFDMPSLWWPGTDTTLYSPATAT